MLVQKFQIFPGMAGWETLMLFMLFLFVLLRVQPQTLHKRWSDCEASDGVLYGCILSNGQQGALSFVNQ